MELKKPPLPSHFPISTFLLHKRNYKIDRNYQRESGTWTRLDEQYFIDSLLRGFCVPPIFLLRGKKFYYIIDGQQRLNTIWKFKENKLPLSTKYSEDIIKNGKNNLLPIEKNKYFYKDLDKELQNRFDSYPLPVIFIEDYNDEEIRDLFRRLQRGKPLIPGEILNAYPGDVVIRMRKLANHKFFKNTLFLGGKRYKHYYISAIFMYLEKEGIKDISPKYIFEFFENNPNITKNSDLCLNVNKILNYLSKTFKEKTPELRNPGWIITLYLLTSHLLENYSMVNQKNNLKTFL